MLLDSQLHSKLILKIKTLTLQKEHYNENTK